MYVCVYVCICITYVCIPHYEQRLEHSRLCVVMKTHCKIVSSRGDECEDCYILEFYSVKSSKSTDVSDDPATSIMMIMRCIVFSSMSGPNV